jgi:DNA-binding NarL/FixJ family response regulator
MTTYTSHYESVSNTTKIVLVEDNTEVTNWIIAKIKGLDKLKLAGNLNNYSGAFELIERENPDLVILDLKLPDGNGINLLKEIRRVNINTKVIVLSLNIHAKKTCLNMGADYFFDKGSQLHEFIQKLNEISTNFNNP